jgi:hypothetical protein
VFPYLLFYYEYIKLVLLSQAPVADKVIGDPGVVKSILLISQVGEDVRVPKRAVPEYYGHLNVCKVTVIREIK